MGTILASVLIEEIRRLSFDQGTSPRRSDDDLLAILCSGQRQAAIFKPDISVDNDTMQLASGTKQAVPDSCIQLISLVRNMGTDGETPGRIILIEDLDKFSIKNPYWHAADTSSEVRFYFFNNKDPKHFYNYPPQPTTGRGYVEGIFAVPPTDIADVDHAINIDDIYSTALVDWSMYRINEQDAQISPYARANAIKNWNMFVQALGRMDLTRQQDSPAKDKEDQSNAN